MAMKRELLAAQQEIREAEKILQERARERGATKEKERDSGMER